VRNGERRKGEKGELILGEKEKRRKGVHRSSLFLPFLFSPNISSPHSPILENAVLFFDYKMTTG
jgi:hypothetical protein